MNTESYIHGTSFYHRLDVRPKLLFTLLWSVMIFFIHSWYGLLLSVLIPVIIFIISLHVKETVAAFKRIMPIIVLLFLFLPLQDRGGTVLLSINGFVLITMEGLYRVCRLAARFSSLSFILMLLISTTRSVSIIKGLRYYHLPYTLSLLFSMILRFIPYLGSVFEDIKASMSLRLTEGRRGFPVMPSITAFAVAAVRMIPDTAAALEERGFGRKGRTDYGKLGYTPHLLTQMLFSAILPVIFFLIVR